MSRLEPSFRLIVRTPTGVVVDEAVVAVNVDDRSGRFGLRPGVEPVVAALIPTVLEYRDGAGQTHFVAIDRGALLASRDQVRVAVRKAVPCASLETVRAELVTEARQRQHHVQQVRRSFRALYRHLYAALIEEERAR